VNALGQPLAGLKVVTIEQAVAAPLCSRHLAELGADVVKIERIEGDFARRYDSMVEGEATHFVWLNPGKRSLALDLKSTSGRQVVLDLLHDADVLLSNLGPGAIDRLFGEVELAALNPRLIRCVLSGFGSEGPYAQRKSYDLLVQGEAGVTASTGAEGFPAKCGVSLADLAGGVYGLTAILAALLQRERTGRGSTVEISLFDCLAEWMMPLLLAERYGGGTPPPMGTRHATIVPYGPFRSADQEIINIAVQNERQWRALCVDVLGDPSLVEHPHYRTNELRVAHRAEVERIVSQAVGTMDAREVRLALEGADVPWGDLNSVAQVAEHPVLRDRHRWAPVTLPGGPVVEVLVPAFLAGLDATPRRVPALGEHSEEILRALGYDAQQ